MTTPHWKRLVAFLLTMALVAAACGGSDDEGTAGSDASSESDGADDGGDSGDSDGGGSDDDASGDSEPLFMQVECPVDAHLDAGGPVEVVLWHTLVALTAQTVQDLADDYNASQDVVTIKIENQGSAYIEMENKYIGGIASEDLPDIALMENILTRTMADSLTVLPAQKCLDAEGLDTSAFNPVGVSYYSVEGNLLPGAWSASTDMMYFNKEHFRLAGLDDTAPPETLADIRVAAQAIKDANIETIKEPFVMKIGAWFFEDMLNREGINLMNADNGRSGPPTEVNFTDPQIIELFTEIQALVDEGLMLAVPEQPGQADHYLALATQTSSFGFETSTASTSVEAFLKGKLDLSTITDPGNSTADDVVDLAELSETEVVEAAQSLDIDGAPLPALTQSGTGAMSGNGWYMMSTSPPEVQAAAWDFLKYVSEVEQQALLFTQGSYLPMTPASLELPEVMALFENSLAAQWLEISNNQLSDISPDAPGAQVGAYRDVRTALQDAIDLIVEGADVASTLADAADEANAGLENYNDEFDLN